MYPLKWEDVTSVLAGCNAERAVITSFPCGFFGISMTSIFPPSFAKYPNGLSSLTAPTGAVSSYTNVLCNGVG